MIRTARHCFCFAADDVIVSKDYSGKVTDFCFCNENAILKEQLALLQEQFDWLKKQVFGRKTEQTSVIMDGSTQLSLFPDEKEQAVSVHEKNGNYS